MAFPAIGGNHFGRVRFVALSALRDLAVNTVTEGAVKGAMLALVVFELSYLPGVAGGTRIRYFARKRDIQRRMRILVTAEAALKFEVGLSHMTVAALWNGFLDRRLMADMTARTPDVLMFSSGGRYIRRRNFMAL